MTSRLFFCLLCASLSLGASDALAGGTWPTYAHDFNRTNRADGVGNMHQPTVAWTEQMGGTLGAGQSLVADVDGDGRANVVTITGGRVVASQPDGTALWQAPLSGARGLLGVWRLSGTTPDVVVDTPTGVQVLEGTNGNLLTTLVTGGLTKAVFVPESTQGGILVLVTSRGPTSGFDFRGTTSVNTPLWTITSNNQTDWAAGDMDGDGVLDLIHPLDAGFEVDDPLTGATKYAFPLSDGGASPMGPPAYFYLYELANVDGNPGDEIIAFDTSYLYSPDTGVYVVSVKNGALETLWSSAVTATTALDADTYSVAGSAADLDGDGTFEVVYSRWDGTAQTWTTYVADAATGANLGTLSGQFLQAVADCDGDGAQDIVVRAAPLATQLPARSTLKAYDFSSRQTGPVVKSWALSEARVMLVSADQRPGPWAHINVPVAAAFDSTTTALELLVGQDTADRGDDTQYLLLRGSNGSAAASVSVAATVEPTAIGWGDGLSSATSKNDVVAFTSDGIVHVDSDTLTESAAFGAGTFSNWVYVNARPTANNLIFTTTANSHLYWLDGTHIHANGTPYLLFDETSVVQDPAEASAGWPLDPVVAIGGTSPTYVSFEQNLTQTSTEVSLVAHDPTGLELWRTPLAEGTQVESPGAYVTDLTGDGVPDVLLSVVTSAGNESLAIFDGTTGNLVRSTPLSAILNADELFTGTLIDVNGDNVPDLIAPEHLNGQVAIDLSKDPMSLIWVLFRSGFDDYNGTIGASQLDPVDSGTGPTIFRVNGNIGFGTYQRYSLAGTVLSSVSPGLPLNQGFDENSVALVQRAGTGAFDLLAAGTGDVGLSRLERFAGDTLSTVWTEYLANGIVTSAPPSRGYALHDPLEVDVDGDGVEDVVFGSDDGYLYAVRSTDGSLVFSVNLGTPVNHVVAANVDTDTQLELVASLGDGRLVALDDHYAATFDSDGGAPDAAGADSAVDATADSAPEAAPEGGAAAGEAGFDGGSSTPGTGSSGCGCKTTADAGALDYTLGTAWAVGFGALALGRRRSRRS